MLGGLEGSWIGWRDVGRVDRMFCGLMGFWVVKGMLAELVGCWLGWSDFG